MRTDYVVLWLADRLLIRRGYDSLSEAYDQAQRSAVAGGRSDDLETYSQMLMGLYIFLATVILILGLFGQKLAPPAATFAVVGAATCGGGLMTLALNHATVRVSVNGETGAEDVRFGYGPVVSAVVFVCASLGYVAALG